MKRIVITAALIAATITTAHAGSNVCEGTVRVGKKWTTIKGETGDHAPDGCRFLTASPLGRRILSVCPDGSECSIDLRLSKRSLTVNSVTNVMRGGQ